MGLKEGKRKGSIEEQEQDNKKQETGKKFNEKSKTVWEMRNNERDVKLNEMRNKARENWVDICG